MPTRTTFPVFTASIKETQQVLGRVSKRIVMKAIASGQLPAIKLGPRCWRVHRAGIAALLNVSVNDIWPPSGEADRRQQELAAINERFGKPRPKPAAAAPGPAPEAA